MEVWNLLKAFVREFEIANNCEFDNSAWERIKKLEKDINRIIDKREKETREMYESIEDKHSCDMQINKS